jgi:hypothetical protein
MSNGPLKKHRSRDLREFDQALNNFPFGGKKVGFFNDRYNVAPYAIAERSTLAPLSLSLPKEN